MRMPVSSPAAIPISARLSFGSAAQPDRQIDANPRHVFPLRAAIGVARYLHRQARGPGAFSRSVLLFFPDHDVVDRRAFRVRGLGGKGPRLAVLGEDKCDGSDYFSGLLVDGNVPAFTFWNAQKPRYGKSASKRVRISSRYNTSISTIRSCTTSMIRNPFLESSATLR